MRTPWIAAFLLAIFSILPGCGSQKLSGPAARQEEPPHSLVSACVENRVALTGLRAEALMRFIDNASDFRLRVQADILAQKPDLLRLRASRAMGNVQVFDTVLSGENIAFHVPRKRVLYQGQVSDLAKAEIKFDPAEILRQLLQPDTGLVLRSWRFAENSGHGDEVALVESAPVSGRQMRLTIDRRGLDLLGLEELDRSGRVVFRKTLSRYGSVPDKVGEGVAAENGRYVRRPFRRTYAGRFPYEIELAWPQQERSVHIFFKRLEPDPALLPAVWLLGIPDGTRRRPISKIEVESDQPEGAETPAKEQP